MSKSSLMAGAALAAMVLAGPAFAASVEADGHVSSQAAEQARMNATMDMAATAGASQQAPAPVGLNATDQMLYEKGLAATDNPDQTPDAQRETNALNLLNNEGYGAPRDLRAEGNVFVATADRDGGTHVVVIDPEAGTVTQQ
ncbi:hypothetical protein [Zavarzinia sp. CC-PAN008]|uniref:hypothetical protein n=1 Tax=Zavarzinia sp. CC-PAN008 TaxID=3243332 RepID=UPI003F7479D1